MSYRTMIGNIYPGISTDQNFSNCPNKCGYQQPVKLTNPIKHAKPYCKKYSGERYIKDWPIFSTDNSYKHSHKHHCKTVKTHYYTKILRSCLAEYIINLQR